jgi:hypothetical protein
MPPKRCDYETPPLCDKALVLLGLLEIRSMLWKEPPMWPLEQSNLPHPLLLMHNTWYHSHRKKTPLLCKNVS